MPLEDARDRVASATNKTSQLEYQEFPDPVKFLSTVSFTELPESPVLNAQTGSTTLSVLNTERIKLQNTGAVSVTDFLYGQEGQQISLLGDGFTTIVHGTKIKTNTGANKLLSANQVYILTRIGSVWIEAAASGTSYTAGAGIDISGSSIRQTASGVNLIGGPIAISRGAGSLTSSIGSKHVGVRINASGYTNVRISWSGEMTTGGWFDPIFSYSTDNGSSWTDTSALTSARINQGAGYVYKTDTISLPVGARISNLWIRDRMLSDDNFAGSCVGTISSFHVEFSP